MNPRNCDKESVHEPTLCMPDDEKSCFACCPPIRPAGYEHRHYKGMVQRVVRENTAAFSTKSAEVVPITGFSCWALGYLDAGYRLVGCLLHPLRNGGEDLRFRVDYGEKCRRETCLPARRFMELAPDERRFWLRLARGMDSFSYSSPTVNPLFRLSGWGRRLLAQIASQEDSEGFTKETFFKTYPLFSSERRPRADAYLLESLVDERTAHLLKSAPFVSDFAALSESLVREFSVSTETVTNAPYVHRLDLDEVFTDFLRFSLGISKIHQEGAEGLKRRVDDRIHTFRERFL